jgi:hypothetical protein
MCREPAIYYVVSQADGRAVRHAVAYCRSNIIEAVCDELRNLERLQEIQASKTQNTILL